MDEVRLDRFIERLRGLSTVGRWNFHHRLTVENVAEHSFWVGMYAYILACMDGLSLEMRMSAMHAGMCHDLEESVSGDLPLLVKREVGDDWERVAKAAFNQLTKFLPSGDLNAGLFLGWATVPSIKKYVKAADILDCVIYARTERKLGNTNFAEIEKECVTSLRRMQMASVDKILDAFGYHKFEHSAVELPKDMTHL